MTTLRLIVPEPGTTGFSVFVKSYYFGKTINPVFDMYRISILALLLVTFNYTAIAQHRTKRAGYGDEPTHFRIGIDGGWSYRIAKVNSNLDPVLKSFVKELKSGSSFSGDATYYFNSDLGVGLLYSVFRSQNEITGVTVFDTATKKSATGMLSDQISIQFIGPTFSARQRLGRNGNVHIAAFISLGYMSYKEKMTIVNEALTFKGGTLGSSLALTFDVALTPNIFIGAKFGTANGTLSSITVDNGTTTEQLKLEEEERESLARIDLSAGLRFHF